MTKENKKWLTIGGAALGALVLYKVLAPKTDTSGPAYDPTGNGGYSPGTGTGTGTGGTGIPFNAKAIAEKLYNAMKEMGTDESAIFEALKPVANDTMFNQVRAEFGKRSYNKLTGNQINYIPFTTLPLVNLPEWLKNELSDANYNMLRKKFPQNL